MMLSIFSISSISISRILSTRGNEHMANLHMEITLIVLMLLNSSCAHNCSISKAQTLVDLDCSDDNLQKVPSDLPPNTRNLDLSRNHISNMSGSPFRNLISLVALNLSGSRIQEVDEHTFRGLTKLNILSLANNPVIYNGKLPSKIFTGCRSLKKLYMFDSKMTGHNISLEPILQLYKLEQLTITPSVQLPYALTKISSLKVLNLPFSKSKIHLTEDNMQQFTKMKLEEISFHSSFVHSVENGTFTDFVSLKLLNFACNAYLVVDDIIDVLSSSQNVSINSLILISILHNVGVSNGIQP